MFSKAQIQRMAASELPNLAGRDEIARGIQRQREEGFGWRFDGLGDWSTEAIFDKLRELGVDTDTERFPDQARRAGRCSVLEESWTGGNERDDLWDDFPFLASEELWRRLTPDLLCPEIISYDLDAALGASGEGGRPPAERMRSDIRTAMRLMDYLDSFPADERPARYEEVAECSLYDYSDWLLDMILGAGGDYPDEVTRIADAMAQIDPGNAANFQGELPLVLVQAGRPEEARQRAEANLRRFPEDVWTLVRTGDLYDELGEHAAALEFYVDALRRTPDPNDWDAVRDRTTKLLEKMGRAGDWAEIERESPRPAEPRTIRRAAREAPPPMPFRSGPKTGPNEPCPCGSGKKYKKCCRMKA